MNTVGERKKPTVRKAITWRTRTSLQNRHLRVNPATVGLLVVLGGILIFFCVVAPNFATTTNAGDVLQQMGDLAIASAGASLIMISGGLDLSVGANASISGVVAAFLARSTHFFGSVPLSWIAALCVGAVVGAVNGQLITRARINPLIATLGTLTIMEGLGYIFTGGEAVTGVPSSFSWLGDTYVVANINLSVVIALVVLILCGFILLRTRLGRYIYAIGGNAEAARLAGIRVPKIQRRVYIVGGILAAGTGIIVASQLGTGDPSSFSGYELTVITAVVLGGIPLSGGQGSIVGTIIGVAILSVLDDGLILLNVSPYLTYVVQGLALLIAVAIGQIHWRVRQRSTSTNVPMAVKRNAENPERVAEGSCRV